MKPLKIISIVSYLLICSTDPKGFTIIIMLLIYLVDFFQSLTYNNLGISWNSFIFSTLTIATLFIFFKCKKYADRYLQIFCFLVLLISLTVFSGIFNFNYSISNLYFLLPFLIFITSSVTLIFMSFKKITLQEKI
ncbi:hypothetical protein SAMN05216273_102176 [Chryseobacterium taihuense]|uniref:Uncharacterized protein n=1 Tax=Chryseobacterium taihuense TaxID=1141221 RepID=A0ABY0QQV3_9FLAO|nr:hypothetical protein SAMN05216273_102176 [Chryseobacterium taihuense]